MDEILPSYMGIIVSLNNLYFMESIRPGFLMAHMAQFTIPKFGTLLKCINVNVKG